jgi:hypothetical protein
MSDFEFEIQLTVKVAETLTVPAVAVMTTVLKKRVRFKDLGGELPGGIMEGPERCPAVPHSAKERVTDSW